MIGVPAYGGQKPDWWSRILTIAIKSEDFGMEYRGPLINATAEVAYNQNRIAEEFLKTDVEWLFWIETDIIPPAAGLGRLKETGKTLVNGLAFTKKHPYKPAAYQRDKNGMYHNITNFTPGEIIKVAGAGMACTLMHRSVLETIKENYAVLQRLSGGLFTVHKDKIKGKIRQDRRNRSDGEVRNGVLQERVIEPTNPGLPYPFFVSEFGRTSDFYFYERCWELGIPVYVDTGVVCDHSGSKNYNLEDYKKQVLYKELGKNTPPELLHESA